MDDRLRQTLAYVKSLTDIKCDVPGFKGELEPHQRVGVAFSVLAKHLILGDFCGAGKTVMAIAADLKFRRLGEVRRTLVVCLSDKRQDWKEEFQKFSDLPVYVIDGDRNGRVSRWIEGCQDTGVVVAAYEQVRADMLMRTKDELGHKYFVPSGLLKHIGFDHVIFDEASLFKSWESVLADSLRALISHCKPAACMALTATPIEKTVEDIISIMNKVEPSLFPDYNYFMARYVNRSRIEKHTPRGRTISFWKVNGYRNLEELSYVMTPYYIGRKREQVYGDRTKKVRKVRYVEMKPSQSKAYQALRDSVDEGMRRSDMLRVHAEMERIVDTMAYFGEDKSSAKIDDIMHLLKGELLGEKVLIFSKFHKPHDELRERFQEIGITYIDYTGRQTVEQREISRHAFLDDPSIQVALITKAAEMGKNFHSAHYIMFLNHVYNPSKVDQTIGRIDRGHAQLSDFICSIHYACKNTFEEDIVPKLDKERDLMHKVFGGSDDTIELLSDDQLYKLIKYGRVAL